MQGAVPSFNSTRYIINSFNTDYGSYMHLLCLYSTHCHLLLQTYQSESCYVNTPDICHRKSNKLRYLKFFSDIDAIFGNLEMIWMYLFANLWWKIIVLSRKLFVESSFVNNIHWSVLDQKTPTLLPNWD